MLRLLSHFQYAKHGAEQNYFFLNKMNDCPPKIEALHRTQVCLLFQLTGIPRSSKTSLCQPHVVLVKYIFLYIWIYGLLW